MSNTQHSFLNRLTAEDAVGQLRRHIAKMASLGSENGSLKLDWVDSVEHLLSDSSLLESVEAEAIALWQQGIRHIIWAGMGGSIITVRVLAKLGFCDDHNGEHIAIYPLDSTDPAAINTIVRQIAAAKNISLPQQGTELDQSTLKQLFEDVMMIGVAMGMTSEEPITHLAWFTELLQQVHLSPAEHLLVMTLPDSYLDRFAREQHAPSRPLQLDGGNGTGGRMSAPGTRVFLLPAALYLTRSSSTPGQLRKVLTQAWQDYDLDLATRSPAKHPFVQLAAALSTASLDGACRLLLQFPTAWQPLVSWIEQLMEESLGKGNKGVIVFPAQEPEPQGMCFQTNGLLRVHIVADAPSSSTQTDAHAFTLYQPSLASTDPLARLAATATSFLGWQLTMALYGYLHDITFAGQPAVENYKAGARQLRTLADPLQAVGDWPSTFKEANLTLLAPSETPSKNTPATAFAATIIEASKHTDPHKRPGYLDFTINGEVPFPFQQTVMAQFGYLSNSLLGIPFKLRTAPADYHSTEQSEMDGPPCLVSLRILMREHEQILLGTYTDTFLRAQAISTWQAMIGQNRTCFLLLIDGTAEQARTSIQQFLHVTAQYISNNPG